ncbi:MAG: SLBB domain-containing protein [Deltaproteobacteria bacterium]|nr:SLBB domain-containing protein [Deltaproteobacteria bacterium]
MAQQITIPSEITSSTDLQQAIESGKMTPERIEELLKSTKETGVEKEKKGRENEKPGGKLIEKKAMIYLFGNVLHPGEYTYEQGMRILDILPGFESLKKDTYLDYALIRRYRFSESEDETEAGSKKVKQLSIDLRRLLVFNDETQNILLMPEDEIYIFNKSLALKKGLIDTEDVFFRKVKDPESSMLHIYGHKLFSSPPSTFAPIDSAPISNDYIVGPGDEVKILMWGRLDAAFNLVVDKEGTLAIPKIGPLTVAGLTFVELKNLIKHKIETITGVNVIISMGRLRSIQVFVLGEVKAPGVYTISSLATVINALLSSGGPTDLGSLRMVQLKRKGKVVTTIDLYDFLLKGDNSKDTRLMPGDTIFVPKVGPMISITGNVKRPAIYELKGNLTLINAIDLAGGLTPEAYDQRIQIERSIDNKDNIVIDVAYDESKSVKSVILHDGDLIRVFSILPLAINEVYLSGNVLRPGKYEFKKGMHISDILPDLGVLKEDAYFDYALIKRYHLESMKHELIPFDLGALLLLNDKSQDIKLLPGDEIYIYNKNVFEDKANAEIKGPVRKPGRYLIDIKDMRIKDLVFKAGNLTKDVYLKLGHLYRTDIHTNEMTVVPFNLEKVMNEDPKHNLLLEDQDLVVFHSKSEFIEEYNVEIKGMVGTPGKYPYAANINTKDLILMAGNVKDAAYMEEAELVRYYITDNKRVETSIINFNVNLALKNDPLHNIKLQPFDVVTIKQIPEWLDKEKSVTITGEVYLPGKYLIRKNEKISDVIERAGGYTDYAYLRGSVFTRESVREIQQERIENLQQKLEAEIARMSSEKMQTAVSAEDLAAQEKFFAAQDILIAKLKQAKASGRVVVDLLPIDILKNSKRDIILKNGDTIHIPGEPGTVSVLGAVYNPTSFLFDPTHPEVKFYLDKTGGPNNNANEKTMYIIRSNGIVVSKQGGASSGVAWSSQEKRWGFWGKFEDAELYPGDTILVPEKIIRPAYLRDFKDITQILYQIAVTAGITITQVF